MRLLFLCLFLGGCGSGLSQPLTDPATASQGQGYKWYVRECGKCHSYYPANTYSNAEWQTILKRKKNKVSLTASQFAELEQYLTINAQPPKP